jgi:ATP-binding cassette subfamily B (MDR/TAP) protein 1
MNEPNRSNYHRTNEKGDDANLGPDERAVLDHQTYVPETFLSSIPFLLSRVSTLDGALLLISAIAAIISGAISPLTTVSPSTTVQSMQHF